MFKYFGNLPIFRRLFIAFALTTVIPGVVIVLLGTFALNTIDIRGQAVRTSFDAQSIASQEQTNLHSMDAQLDTRFAQIYASKGSAVNDPSLNASGELLANDIRVRELEFDQTLQTYKSNFEVATSPGMQNIRNILLSDDPHNSAIIDAQRLALDNVSQREWNTYKQAVDKVLQLLLPNPKTGIVDTSFRTAYAALFNVHKQFLPLRIDWQSVVDAAVTIGTTVTQVGPTQTQPILAFTAGAFLFTILVIITTGYLVNVTITQPLRQLALLTRRITKGDTNARVGIKSRDEIGLVAASMNNMLDNIVRLIQEAQSRHGVLQAQVEKLVSEVSGVGEGDLRIQAEVTTDDLGVLADSFNYMVEELSGLVVRVKMLAKEVENATTQTFNRMAQLVASADNQINQIATAEVEVGNMTNSSRQVAERAQVLYDTAYDMQQTAQKGGHSVRQAIEGMGRIFENVQSTAGKVQLLGERSREISNIMEVISSIAHQTNRLALDAAIQAAMAGENGKGFGAVAADIRRLAERSKEQATMITRIVRSVLEDIGAASLAMNETERETSMGTQLAQEAGHALEAVFPVVERQANEIETINQMAMQQLQSSRAVVQIMQHVSDTTQQSSASIRAVSEEMERMARLAEQLRASVEAFKLREEQNDYYTLLARSEVPTEQQPENALTFSGMFRTITASAQSSNDGGYKEITQEEYANSAHYPPTSYQYPAGQPLPPPNPAWQNGNRLSR